MTTANADREWAQFCADLRRVTGIDLSQYKRAQMERRIRTFMSSRGHGDDLAAYGKYLGRDNEELDKFLDRITINVSQLWRNADQWKLLAGDVLPELLANGEMTAWSAGCSYGAEAYTIAALALETRPGARVRVVGTDLDRRMVDRARAGVFNDADAREVPADKLKRWFDPQENGYQAKAELRRLVSFEVGDLLKPRAGRKFDLVCCRNVVIYFTEEVRDALHERLAQTLRPGGYLLIGSTERVTQPPAIGLEAVRPFLYRRTA